eukprot:TRINITY_DN18843_c0_g1_i1.p1 TRINITY_DN18843_c0_g1~~TRINITY_DN18843_c0_g1_i1.p1  ORF type:complete len:109 (-),score=14.14 TRINITY_DN18843_c0_g1_i1:40-366(-)
MLPSLLFLCISFLPLLSSSPLPSPESDLHPHCEEYSDLRAMDCTYGITTNHCGQPACLRGPGQICGGSYGSCADNLLCSLHSRCEGCSFTTFLCWDNDSGSHAYYINI